MYVHNEVVPFAADFDAWAASAEIYDSVFHIAASHWTPNDPPLWTPLISPTERSAAFFRHHNICINCGTAGYSLKTCPGPCRTVFDLLNRVHTQHEAACRRWQQRIRHCRRNRSRHDGNNRCYSRDNGNRGTNTAIATTTVAPHQSILPVLHAHLMLRLPRYLRVASIVYCHRTCSSQPFPLAIHCVKGWR